MTDTKLRKYKLLRSHCLTEMSVLLDLAQRSETDKSVRNLFKVRACEIDFLRDEFNKQHQNIFSVLINDPQADMDVETGIREGFLNEFDDVASTSFPTSRRQSTFTGQGNPQVRLPQLEIPKFKGDYRTFTSYIDLYDALIHNNPSLSTIEKFNYLIASLEEQPLSLVRTLPMTSRNYQTAYETLKNRYSNKRVTAQMHWLALENTQKINSKDSNALRQLLDVFSENIAALKNIGFDTDNWDFPLLMMIMKRLDSAVITKFELEHNTSDAIPKYSTLFDFLEKYCQIYNTLNSSSGKSEELSRKKFVSKPSSSFQRTNSFFVDNQNSIKCPFCKHEHHLFNCKSFINKTPHERFDFCRNSHRCMNCLSTLHDSKHCKSTGTCRTCNLRHHTLLHLSKPRVKLSPSHASHSGSNITQNESHSSTSDLQRPASVAPLFSATGVTNDKCTLLSTALVQIKDNFGSFRTCRALLDSGSMTTFITSKCVNRLNLQKLPSSTEVNGVNSMQTSVSNGSVVLTINNHVEITSPLVADAVILNKICDLMPSARICIDSWKHIIDLKLADPHFYIPSQIDLLLGADLFSNILMDGLVSGEAGHPDAINTIFGYVLLGKMSSHFSQSVQSFCLSTSTDEYDSSLHSALQQFWELEEISTEIPPTHDEVACENHFASSVTRDQSGKFVVSLPFRDTDHLPAFTGSRELAINKFLSLERRLLKQPSLYQDYCNFMSEYLSLDHMTKVPNFTSPFMYYIPHHAIVKADSLTTRLRVVFNCSAKDANFTSLNDKLLIGPKLQRDIFSILLNFRTHRYVLCTDIKQMYRNVLIAENHRDFQRIIWRFSPNESLQDFRLNTVTYGSNCGPYLALRTLRQLADEYSSEFPLAAQALRIDTYIDDICTGMSTLKDAINLRDELIALLKKGGFLLHKCSSNETSLLSSLDSSLLSMSSLSFEADKEQIALKVLGLQWTPAKDCFRFSVNCIERRCTKRNLLSEFARIFDPMGFLAPITFLTKFLIQRLWTLGIGWDDEPTQDIIRLWSAYRTELSQLSSLSIPREIAFHKAHSVYELHGFCDASERGFAAVVYVRIISDNSVTVNFLCSKTKVAPLKPVTIPRLELCGASLLAKLMSQICRIYQDRIKFDHVFAWSDSKIVLCWIKSLPHRWKTFVANRVADIQTKIPPERWFHVSSQNNAADVASRGMLPNEFLQCSVWFTGPSFLHVSESLPHISPFQHFSSPEISEEERKTTLFSFGNDSLNSDSFIETYSHFLLLQRITAFILRFIHNSRNPTRRYSGSLTYVELDKALLALVKYTQRIAFQDEINRPHFSKPLRKLKVFQDESDLLRVGGRLKYADIPNDAKHPLLLPRTSHLTSLLIDFYHKKYLHAGSRTLHFLLAQRFWILSPKRAIQSVLLKCVTCWKINPISFQPPMGDLPSSRISQAKPFSHSGVDFGGPFSIVMTRHRGVRTCKAYVCLFVCFATKAMHLELASDLSSDVFLAALQRFIARRGRCNKMTSDNGTNFVAAHKKILKLMKDAACRESIDWQFNPPSAPHFGGLFEAGIKSVKSHLNRVIGQQILTYEEFSTVLVMIESILNSRPLCSMSSDIEDIKALTPGHFLTMEPLTALPTPDMTSLPINRLSRWQLLLRIHWDFWKRWHREYLHTLQQRGKWLDASSPPAVGTLVLIKNESVPPNQWLLARIISLAPGADGVARVATVKTQTNTLTRPLVKLCPLPIS